MQGNVLSWFWDVMYQSEVIYCKRRSDIKSQHTKSISLSLLQWKQPTVTYNIGEPCSHIEKCSVCHKLCIYRGILIFHMYFITNICPFVGLHWVAQIKLRYKKPMFKFYVLFTQDSWCVFWKRFIFLTAVYDFLWDSRTTNVFSLNDGVGSVSTSETFGWSCFLMEKDNPLENRIKDPTLFSKETDGNLFSRQSDMKLLYGQNINSIFWKSGYNKSYHLMEPVFGYPAIFLRNPFDLQHVVKIKGQFQQQ